MKWLGRAARLAVCACSGGLLVARPAGAYVWMLSTEHSGCVSCHADPSGGGILTPDGRELGDARLRGAATASPRLGDFAWGAMELPSALWLQVDARAGLLETKVEDQPLDRRLTPVELELLGLFDFDRVRLAASLGYARDTALGAAITGRDDHNLVSREHWIGARLGAERDWVLRAGRMDVPFGLRNVESSLFVRTLTRTRIDDEQTYGVAAAYSGPELRAELMGMAGNFALDDAEARELGYSGYAELIGASKVTIGASSLVAHADRDRIHGVATFRQAHGIFARVAAYKPLVLLLEADWSLETPQGIGHYSGVVTLAQADYELARGVHLIATGELSTVGRPGHPPSWGTWLSYAWFFAPHADLRLDGNYRSLAAGGDRTPELTLLAQAHVYL